jgi:hypothetical protein
MSLRPLLVPTRLKIDQVDAILFAEQRMINIVIMVEQHC